MIEVDCDVYHITEYYSSFISNKMMTNKYQLILLIFSVAFPLSRLLPRNTLELKLTISVFVIIHKSLFHEIYNSNHSYYLIDN